MTIERCQRCLEHNAGNQVVGECLPVNAFGDISGNSVKLATIGLNPALNEFYESAKAVRSDLRLPVLSDYGANERESLRDSDLEDARQRRKNYFANSQRNWHSYFEKLENFISRVDPRWSYASGRAVHVDLVACATRERWGCLNEKCKTELLNKCRDHFLSTLSELPDGAFLFFDGKTSLDEMPKWGLGLVNKTNKGLLNLDGTHVCLGEFVLGLKKFRFWGWSMPIGKMSLINRYNVASWVCETMDPPLPFYPVLK